MQYLPDITNRQFDIIHALLSFRFLTTAQIQQILNHKYKERISDWLNDLTEKKYILRFYNKEFAGKPAIYCLASLSVPLLKIKDKDKQEIDNKIYERIYEEKKRTEGFRNRWVLIGQIYLLLTALTKNVNYPFTFHTQSDLEGMEDLITPIPHAYFTIKESKRKVKRYFLDVFDFYRKWGEYKKRLREYTDYYTSNLWQENTKHPFPEVILICPENRVQKYVTYWARRYSEDKEIQFYTSTWQEVQSKGLCSEALHKVV